MQATGYRTPGPIDRGHSAAAIAPHVPDGRAHEASYRFARARAPVALVFGVGLSSLLAGCSGDDASQPSAPPPPLVQTLVVVPQAVPNEVELLGRVEPFRVSEVRARTDGLVEAVVYEEGSDVRAGDVLFRIDPRTVQANADEAAAGLESARVAADSARTAAERAERLVGEQAISRQDYDDARELARTTASAAVQAEAALRAARIALDEAEVTAPIAGRAGRAQVREGSLVSAAEGTLLVTIRQTGQVYVNLARSATDLLAVRERILSGDIELAEGGDVAVDLLAQDGTALGVSGRIDLLDLTVDEDTGTVTLRAVFPNADGRLLPGQLVDARVHAGRRPGAIVVPQPAVLLGTDSAAVLVAENGTAHRRPVQLGEMIDGGWLVESGLEPGDEIVLDHLQKLADGAPLRLARLEGEGEGAAPGSGGAEATGNSGTAGDTGSADGAAAAER